MKCAFTSLLIIVPFILFSQKFEESGIDSIKNIYWETSIRTTDLDGIPNNFERFEYSLDPCDMIVVIRCEDSIPYMQLNYNVPPSCLYWQKSNDSTVNAYSVSKSGGSLQKDSVQLVDQDCVDNYYVKNRENLHIDTIYIGRKVKITDDEYSLINETSYYYSKKMGTSMVSINLAS